MSFDESLAIEIFDEERSREIIIDFIQTRPGCIAEDILRGEKQIGRKKLFRILGDLKEEKVIIEEKRKSKQKVRNKRLFVNGANPQTVVLNELKNFEKIYFSILNKTVYAYNNGRYLGDWQKSSKDFDGDDLVKRLSAIALMWQPLHIFYGFLKIYIVRLITNWSKEIRDKDVLNKVNNMIFAKFTSMQIRTNKIMASVTGGIGSASIGAPYMHVQINTIEQLNEKLKTLKEYDMEKETKELLKLVEGTFVTEEIRSYFRRKNKLYRWDLKYKDDDIQELAEDIYRHQDDIYDGYYSDSMISDPVL
jgi:hypothetical protein